MEVIEDYIKKEHKNIQHIKENLEAKKTKYSNLQSLEQKISNENNLL